MSLFNKCDDDYIRISRRPNNIQENGAAVSAATAALVYSGEKVEFDDFLYALFAGYINRECKTFNIRCLIMTVIGAAALIRTIILTIVSLMDTMEPNDASGSFWTHGSVGISLLIAILFLALAYYVRHCTEKYMKALKAAENGSLSCYRYCCYFRLIYEDTSGDGVSYEYYIDLGGFAVTLTDSLKKAPKSDHALAAVVDIDGKDYFFMFKV